MFTLDIKKKAEYNRKHKAMACSVYYPDFGRALYRITYNGGLIQIYGMPTIPMKHRLEAIN